MLVIHSYSIAIIMCIITMICWGSWANTTKLVDEKKWPFQLYYWDYSIGILLFTLLLAFTLGSSGDEGRHFIADLQQADWHNFGLAILGGIIFNLGNILLVAAIALAGMAVAFPVGVGIALVLGVIVNYLAVPVGEPYVLFIGVACVTVAIILTAIAYGRLKQQQSAKMRGLITAIIAGVVMGWFYRFVAASMAADFSAPAAGLLTPYSALVFFAIGVLLSSFVWNTIMMKKPISGPVINGSDYFKGTVKEHAVGILGGIIWSIGMSFSILASGPAGYAISYGLGQGATMIAVIWGVFVWREFASAAAGTNKLINAMFAFYILGIALIIAANSI
ncbi:GRP family sugar transporter [Aeromonas allosaccharophila]|uniref:GRP family sugar transporter n=1 Tax=Aeromonas allosaccharophila TaxID=656 RepID=UPI002B462EBF|nr:GRP family sugar transporter [Aeromonas allosaccharophila]